MSKEAAWRNYEREVHAEIRSKYPTATVEYDIRLSGRRSTGARQIDVLITEHGAREIVTAVDAKHHSRPVDVKDVESFIGLLHDVGMRRGIMVSASGYTRAALNRAFRDDLDLDLDVFSLAEYQRWQSCGAITYSGGNGVLLSTPLGWVVDAQRFPGTLARLYRRGSTFDRACVEKEFMYVNIHDRDDVVTSLDDLLVLQARDLHDLSSNVVITIQELDRQRGARLLIRRADVPQYPTAEITGFAEFKDFIFFAVLFTPLMIERRNVRKLEYLLGSVLPLSIHHEA